MAKRFNRWVKFHRDNPRIWELFKKYAEEALDAGRTHFSARLIGERIRWYHSVQVISNPKSGPKFNDHIWPYYGRLLMLTDERFADFFTRKDTRFDATDEMIIQSGTD